MSWGMMQGMIRATGGAISMTQRLVASTVLGSIQALTPIVSAAMGAGIASMNPAQIAAAIVGFGEIAAAIAAYITFEAGKKETSLQLRGLNFMLSNISMMLTTIKL